MAVSISELEPAIRAELGEQFTSLDEPVYFATSKADPMVVGTAMARFSRSPDGLREIVGNEFSGAKTGRDAGVRERIFNQYGDDSVAQLVTLQAVVEGASNLLTKTLEWGRLQSYLEQSTRYLRFDSRDQTGKFPLFTPTELTEEDRFIYDEKMEQVFLRYSGAITAMEDYLAQILKKPVELSPGEWKGTLRAQACDAARAILPVSVIANVGIVGSAQSFENLLLRLRASDISEARTVGDLMLRGAREVAPEFMRRVDMPDRGNMASAYITDQRERVREWAEELGINGLPKPEGEKVQLVEFNPRDELEVAKYILFDGSTLSIDGIEKVLATRTECEVRSIIRDYIHERTNRRHKPGRAFEHPHYTLEFITDYGIFRDLQRHRMVDDLRWQILTPHHGHTTIPELACQAGVDDLYREAYEISEELHAFLTERYGPVLAQYATMLGHNMRWTMTENAREAYHIHELRTSSQGHPGYRRVVNEMHRQLTAVHPTIAEGMVHVDTSDNPELTRLNEALRTAKKARDSGMQ